MNPLQNPHRETRAAVEIACQGTLIIDVRAPKEFDKAHLPNSINIPILNDTERHQVGLTYRLDGQAAATKLGYELVSGDVKDARISAWQQAIESAASHALVMCWRGGARSQIAQRWLHEAGVAVGRVEGGYKSVRQACLATLDRAPQQNWWVIGGRTGVGKTVALNQLKFSIDLEAIACHRGSAFGRWPGHEKPQPEQATFENQLAWASILNPGAQIIVEDESRMIGRTALPQAWLNKMQNAPLVCIETNVSTRSAHIYNEYVKQPLDMGLTREQLHAHLAGCLARISRRLGGVRHQTIQTLLDAAFANKASHEDWISSLLTDYYDPMYDYQLAEKADRVIFKGEADAVVEYLREQTEQRSPQTETGHN